MNQVIQAKDLLLKFRRHRAIMRPRLAQFAYHWMRGTTAPPYGPLKMHVEPTSFCNLRCPMCPQSVGANATNGFMAMDLYAKIIDEARHFVREINLFFRGESLMHRHIWAMVDTCERAGIAAHINTNATLLRDDAVDKLLAAGPSKVTISFDSGEPAVYERMRKGARFDKTLDRVLHLLAEKRRRGLRKPYVTMQVIQLWDKSRGAGARPVIPEDFRARFAGLPVDEWDTFWAHGWAGTMNESSFYTPRPHGSVYYPCNWLWKSMAVYWDGRVPACCADFGEHQLMGDLNTQSIREVWNSAAFREIRAAHVSGDLSNWKLCKGCDAVWQTDSGPWKAFATARSLVNVDPLPVFQNGRAHATAAGSKGSAT
ncbi:MAG: radical SAM protein [Actinobacteria bacterium]|nr:radical SAM protein [Actinomycetota bacterium]